MPIPFGGVIPRSQPNLALLGQLDQIHRRFVSRGRAGAAPERRLKCPDWCASGTPDVFEWNTREGFTSLALHFEPAVSPVDALSDGWRRLRWPAIAFHLLRPQKALRRVAFSDSFLCAFACRLHANLRARYSRPEHSRSRRSTHGATTATRSRQIKPLPIA